MFCALLVVEARAQGIAHCSASEGYTRIDLIQKKKVWRDKGFYICSDVRHKTPSFFSELLTVVSHPCDAAQERVAAAERVRAHTP